MDALVRTDPPIEDDPTDWPEDGPLQAGQTQALDVAKPLSLQLVQAIPRGQDKDGKAGPPTKLTRAVARVIVTAVAEGNYPAVAAQLAGIARRTYDQWLERGEREPESRYGQLVLAVAQAEAEAEVAAVNRIRAAGGKDWKADMTLLGRRHRDRWAEQTIDAGTGAKVVVNIGIALPAPGTVAPQLVESERVTVMPPLIGD